MYFALSLSVFGPFLSHGATEHDRSTLFIASELTESEDTPFFDEPGRPMNTASEGYLNEQMLLDAGAKPNTLDKHKRSPLYTAVEYGNEQSLKLLLGKKVKPDIQDYTGETALNRAVHEKLPTIVRILLEKGANPNVCDFKGIGPLQQATVIQDLTILKLLLNHKANPNIRSRMGDTPLAYGAYHATPEAVSALIAAGVDVNALENRFMGRISVLALYAKAGKIEHVKLLLAAGASVDAKGSDEGNSPIDVAEDPAIKQLLMGAGAKH